MSEADRRRRIEEICDGALDCDPTERDAFVAAQCDGDEGLWRDVQSLLAHEAAADRLLETPVAALAAHVVGSSMAPELIGHRVGAYTVLGPLGAGGMGEVYRARDTQL